MDVFFVHPTTFDGGKDWNGPIQDKAAAELYSRVMAPNYAAPFARAGAIFAPRYRQASLYTSLTVFDDAIEAREFAYRDVEAAFAWYLRRLSGGRPFILVGAEQGGELSARLLRNVIGPDPALRRRLVAAYLIDTVTRSVDFGTGAPIQACASRAQAGCVVAWISARQGDFPRVINILTRSKVWSETGALVNLGRDPVLCVNPLLGARSTAVRRRSSISARPMRPALSGGVRPGSMVRQVSAGASEASCASAGRAALHCARGGHGPTV